jgi:hypothetical protein
MMIIHRNFSFPKAWMREDQIEIVHNSAIGESLAFELCKLSETLNELKHPNAKYVLLAHAPYHAVNLAHTNISLTLIVRGLHLFWR